jgi:hypothetical protein
MPRITKKILEQRIERLERDMKILITEPNSSQAAQIRIRYKIINATPESYFDFRNLFKPTTNNQWQQSKSQEETGST